MIEGKEEARTFQLVRAARAEEPGPACSAATAFHLPLHGTQPVPPDPAPSRKLRFAVPAALVRCSSGGDTLPAVCSHSHADTFTGRSVPAATSTAPSSVRRHGPAAGSPRALLLSSCSYPAQSTGVCREPTTAQRRERPHR